MDHNDWFTLSATYSDVNIPTAQQIDINIKKEKKDFWFTPSANSPPIGRRSLNQGELLVYQSEALSDP